MKFQFTKLQGFILGGITAIILIAITSPRTTQSATVTAGYTFATNEVVTASKLDTLVSGATVTGINSADISNGAVGQNQLSANSVTSAKIVDGTIVAGDIADRTIISAKIGTNQVTDVELSSNLTFHAGTTLNFTNATVTFATNQIDSSYVSNAVSTVSGIQKANFTTNILNGQVLIADTYKQIFTYTTTLGSNATVHARFFGRDINFAGVRLKFVQNGAVAGFEGQDANASGATAAVCQPAVYDFIQTSNTTFTAWAYSHAGGTLTNFFPMANFPTMTNATYMTVEEYK